MAIQLEYTTSFGLTATEAYFRIVSSIMHKDLGLYDVTMAVYYDEAARDAELSPLETKLVSISLAYDSTMQDMYDAIKLLPDYTSAVDVLEA